MSDEPRGTFLIIRTRDEDPLVYLVQDRKLEDLRRLCSERDEYLSFIHSLKPAGVGLAGTSSEFNGTLLRREWKSNRSSRAQHYLRGLISALWHTERREGEQLATDCINQLTSELKRFSALRDQLETRRNQ